MPPKQNSVLYLTSIPGNSNGHVLKTRPRVSTCWKKETLMSTTCALLNPVLLSLVPIQGFTQRLKSCAASGRERRVRMETRPPPPAVRGALRGDNAPQRQSFPSTDRSGRVSHGGLCFQGRCAGLFDVSSILRQRDSSRTEELESARAT